MAIGYLTMQTRTAHDAVPLAGVLVTVLDDEQNHVYELRTDENGETRRVPLETVDKRFSLNEDFTGTPFVSYNVLAQAEGFDSVYVADIPIYDGEEAVLPVTDEPLLLKVRMLRSLPSDREMALWAARFVDLILDEEIMIRKSVFSIQVSEKNID